MTLLVLAARMGSRFGGIKQLTPLTNEGEYIIDFTVHDAIKTGFDNIIFIILKDIEDIFEERIGARLRKNGSKVKILKTDAKWCGVTYKEDSEPFKQFISKLKSEGKYPVSLWNE